MNRKAIWGNAVRMAKEQGMSKRDLAGRAGISGETLERYEDRLRVPTAYATYRMAQALGCAMEELMEGIEGAEPDEDPWED